MAVELKNEDRQFARALDQMATVAEYVNSVYLACTPAFAAEYLDRHACVNGVRRWDRDLLERKLEGAGFGLLIVEGERVFEVLRPADRNPHEERFGHVAEALRPGFRVE